MTARPRVWEVAAFAVAFAVAGCVALALVWATDPPHHAVLSRQWAIVFVPPGDPADWATLTVDEASALHSGWAAYVTGRSAEQPARDTEWFTDEERSHMADVRGVFIAAQWLALLAVLALIALSRHARGRLLRLARSGAIAAAAGAVVLALAAALAFDAAFLLFHEVLFPQGNFLFGPDSNLLRLYPEAYWYVMTLGIAASFVALCALVAFAAHIGLRASTRRSAIVSPG